MGGYMGNGNICIIHDWEQQAASNQMEGMCVFYLNRFIVLLLLGW